MNVVFKSNIQFEDRIRKIKEDYGIQVSDQFKQEPHEMTYILDYYKQQGVEQSISKEYDSATLKIYKI